MEKVVLNADIRAEKGKESNRKLRAEGIVPAVVYKKGDQTIPIKVDGKELFHILHTSAGENVIITLKIKGEAKGHKKEDEKTVIIKEIQHEPIKGEMLHVDFNQISLTETIEVKVPIELKGEAEGVKVEGGILDHVMRELEVECLPTDIPERIEVHVETLKIGDSVKVAELNVPSNVKVLSDAESTVISVMPPHVEKPAEELEEAAEVTEPEVIREKKPAEEEQAPPEEEKKKE